jgi:FAD binding domain of DNA photolyase
VFDLYLLDADWALNNANWQWLSCSSFFYQVRHWQPDLTCLAPSLASLTSSSFPSIFSGRLFP